MVLLDVDNVSWPEWPAVCSIISACKFDKPPPTDPAESCLSPVCLYVSASLNEVNGWVQTRVKKDSQNQEPLLTVY